MAIVAAVVPASASAATPSERAVTGPLHTEGRWFRDSLGRAVVLHGLFAVWKGAPHYPPDDLGAQGDGEPHAGGRRQHAAPGPAALRELGPYLAD